ncbi:MAG: helix-turn-helix domain-containing protein [Ruminococcus sp.]|nr:helix-turn-helix domain-containing protein [Ruminococcus sp.]
MKENFTITTNVPEMLGVKETSEKFGISQHYARQLALSGTVKAVRVGRGKILINSQSVADYFNNSYINVSQPAQNISIKPIPVKL